MPTQPVKICQGALGIDYEMSASFGRYQTSLSYMHSMAFAQSMLPTTIKLH